MIPFKRKTFSIIRSLYPFIVALLTCLLGYSAVYFYAYTKEQRLSTQTHYTAISKVDTLFTSLQSTADSVASFKDLDCNIIRPSLKNIATKAYAVESVTILKHNLPYCSSNDQFMSQGLPSLTEAEIIQHPNYPDFYLIFTTKKLFVKKIINVKKQESVLMDVNIYQSIESTLISKHPSQVITLKLYNRIFSNQENNIIPIKTFKKLRIKTFEDTNQQTKNNNSAAFVFTTFSHTYSLILILISILAIALYFLTRWFIRNVSSLYYELNIAIKNNQIKAYAQPIFDTQTGKLMGIEVLARWYHPKFGTVNPDSFIPVAEKTGLIIPMTQKLLSQVAQALEPHAAKLPNNFHIGFNISKVHCENLQLVEDCKNFYREINNDNITLVIEITERELITVTPTTVKLFKELHALKAKIALDDFGVGNSNLSYLYDFSIDYLKIDKSFIARIGSDALSKNILDTIIEITHSCKIESCAEGVETEEQLNYLKEKNVTYLQGYYFSRPLPIQEFIKHQLFFK